MKVIPIVVGAFQVNCYVVTSESGKALVIDPGDDAGIISVTLRQNKLTPAAYLVTHGHMDHVGALAEMIRTFPAPILMHPEDEAWAFTPANAMLPYYDTPEHPGKMDRLASHKEIHEEAGMKFEVLATPGHSPGGVCYYFPAGKTIFTGDTLFSGSVGRTDLEGSNETRLQESLRLLIQLPDDTVVYPGHGPSTTIGREKRHNPFLMGM